MEIVKELWKGEYKYMKETLIEHYPHLICIINQKEEVCTGDITNLRIILYLKHLTYSIYLDHIKHIEMQNMLSISFQNQQNMACFIHISGEDALSLYNKLTPFSPNVISQRDEKQIPSAPNTMHREDVIPATQIKERDRKQERIEAKQIRKNLPKHQRETKDPLSRKRKIIIALVTILAISIIALGVYFMFFHKSDDASDSKAEITKTTSGQAISNKDFTIIKEASGSIDEEGYLIIEGEVKNMANVQADAVEITFILYDKDGKEIGTAIDNTINLGPKKLWKFKAKSPTKNASTFKLSKITAI